MITSHSVITLHPLYMGGYWLGDLKQSLAQSHGYSHSKSWDLIRWVENCYGEVTLGWSAVASRQYNTTQCSIILVVVWMLKALLLCSLPRVYEAIFIGIQLLFHLLDNAFEIFLFALQNLRDYFLLRKVFVNFSNRQNRNVKLVIEVWWWTTSNTSSVITVRSKL